MLAVKQLLRAIRPPAGLERGFVYSRGGFNKSLVRSVGLTSRVVCDSSSGTVVKCVITSF